ncbi:MAG: hypothetical protein V2I27_14390 [Erythrobacter sp.]|jgi:hypothetical protein|nr:hypothetical protein [Erythrobacter sp.]
MSAPAPAPAISTDLWQRLAAYAIGPEAATLPFAARLARENRWSLAHAERVILEYKRFCYLACTAPHEVTPSDAVDQAWHLHLTYSRDYWQRFCAQVLRAELHHGPTAGGKAERARFYRQYADTLQSYEQAFGVAPPSEIWPDAARRFEIDPKAIRVNPSDVMIVSRRGLVAGAIALAAGGALAGYLLAGGV